MWSTIELSGSVGQAVCSVLAWWSVDPDLSTCWKQGMSLSSFSFITGPWSCYHLQVYLLHFLQVTLYRCLNHRTICYHQTYGREVSILSSPNPCRHLLLVSKALSPMFFYGQFYSECKHWQQMHCCNLKWLQLIYMHEFTLLSASCSYPSA